jgi:hypothetical protein
MRMKYLIAYCLITTTVAMGVRLNGLAADKVFSGPQRGERTTSFNVLELTGPNEGKERDAVIENAGAPTALVFVHAIERSLVPLLRVVDQYGAERTNRLKTEIVFLTADRIEGEQRVKAAARSLQLQSRVGLSLDGAEGPGNYGLNKQCMMTIVAAKENKVTANFALVQPGIADAPNVIEALARACGDISPPTVEQLGERQAARTRAANERAAQKQRQATVMERPATVMERPATVMERPATVMERPATVMERPAPSVERGRGESVDFSKFDLNSETGLRDAVRALLGEVRNLRTELAELSGRGISPAKQDNAAKPKEGFPGAVPTDEKLQGLLRRFIRPTNDDATVDQLLAEIESHIKGNADLTKQAIDGWTRILHFGDTYGTAYARKVGREFLDKLKAGAVK